MSFISTPPRQVLLLAAIFVIFNIAAINLLLLKNNNNNSSSSKNPHFWLTSPSSTTITTTTTTRSTLSLINNNGASSHDEDHRVSIDDIVFCVMGGVNPDGKFERLVNQRLTWASVVPTRNFFVASNVSTSIFVSAPSSNANDDSRNIYNNNKKKSSDVYCSNNDNNDSNNELLEIQITNVFEGFDADKIRSGIEETLAINNITPTTPRLLQYRLSQFLQVLALRHMMNRFYPNHNSSSSSSSNSNSNEHQQQGAEEKKKPKWFVFVDDDTFVNLPELLEELSSQQDPSSTTYSGDAPPAPEDKRVIGNFYWLAPKSRRWFQHANIPAEPIQYPGGGAGYAVTPALMQSLAANVDTYLEMMLTDLWNIDVIMGYGMQQEGARFVRHARMFQHWGWYNFARVLSLLVSPSEDYFVEAEAPPPPTPATTTRVSPPPTPQRPKQSSSSSSSMWDTPVTVHPVKDWGRMYYLHKLYTEPAYKGRNNNNNAFAASSQQPAHE